MPYNKNMIYYDEDGGKYKIMRDKEDGLYFNTYNEPKLTKNNFLLFLEKLYRLHVHKFSKSILINSIFSLDYKDIIDLIFKIGTKNEEDKTFVNLLITTL